MDIESLAPGDLVAFRIPRFDHFTSPNTGRWGVMKLIHRAGTEYALAVLAGLHEACPAPGEVARAALLVPRRFRGTPGAAPDEGPLVFTVPRARRMTLDAARVIGRETGWRREERAARALIETEGHPGTFADWTWAAMSLDHEDRFLRDCAAWQADIARYHAAMQAEHDARERRQRTRLRGLTLDTLLSETPFTGWDARPDLLGAAFVAAARVRFHAAQEALAALGPKPPRAAVRRELEDLVAWFNGHADRIDTVEREEIVAAIEELCWASGQKPLAREIDEWRDF